MTQWNGPIHDDNRYEQDTEEGFGHNIAMPEDILFVEGADRDTIKRLIVEYGAVAMEYDSQPDGILYHKANPHGKGAHECAIVGWDDTVEKENFTVANYPKSIASEDGAWIVKNSWGEDCPKEGKGYFYLSYEAPIHRPIAYRMMSRDSYNYNYFYDGFVSFSNGAISPAYLPAANINPENMLTATFKAKMGGTDGKGEYLEGVNIGVASQNTRIHVEVYTNIDEESLKEPENPINGTRAVATGERTVPYAGFYTIELNQPVKLEKDRYFTVVVTMPEGGKICTSRENSTNDLTFRSWPNGNWTKGHSENYRIKAFTKLHSDSEMQNICPDSVALENALRLKVGETVALDAVVSPENVLDRTLTWTSSDENVATVDYSGHLTARSAGNATITVSTVNGKTATCAVSVVIPVEKLTLDKQTLSLEKGSTDTLQTTIEPANATDKVLTWTSSNEGIVAIEINETDGAVRLKAMSAGTATVTATSSNGITASCEITVRELPLPKEPETQETRPTPPTLPTPVPGDKASVATSTKSSASPVSAVKVKTPAVAKSFNVKNKKKKTASLTWKKVSGAKGYEVQYALNKKFTKQKKSKLVTKPKLTVKKLKKGKTYYFRVRAYKINHGKKVYGKWTSIKKVKIRK